MTDDIDPVGADGATDDIDEFERLGRRAADELRRPAPDDGLGVIARSARSRRAVNVVAGSVLAAGIVVATLVIAGRERSDDNVPATVPPTSPTTVAAVAASTEPPVPTHMELHSGLVADLDVSDDGDLVATGTDQGSVHVYDAGTGATVINAVVPSGTPLIYVAISPDKSTVGALADDGVEYFWSIADGTPTNPFAIEWPDPDDRPSPPDGIVLSPDGAIGVRLGRFTGAELVDVPANDTLHRLGTDGTAYTAAFSPDGQLVAVKFDEVVRVWRLDPFEELPGFDLAAYEATGEDIEFTPDSRRLAFTVEDRVVIEEIDLTDSPTTRRLTPPPNRPEEVTPCPQHVLGARPGSLRRSSLRPRSPARDRVGGHIGPRRRVVGAVPAIRRRSVRGGARATRRNRESLPDRRPHRSPPVES